MKKLIIVAIILLGAVVRLYRLDSVPALNADEAALGYNAYSLLENGKDEHGNPWPVHFQSFNDYKPGLYVYIILPFVKIFGLNELSVRLPSALLGIATIYAVFLLTKTISKKQNLALISALLLAINPWHIHFSRGGWEVNVATFFITLGIWAFLEAKQKTKFYIISCFFFVLSLYTYHAARILVPLLLLALSAISFKEVAKNIKTVLIAIILGILLLLPLAKDLTQGAVAARAAGVGLFADTGPFARINEQRGEHGNYTGLTAKVLHNKVANYGLAFLQNWIDHYHIEFLFISGDDIQRNKVPETGQLHLIEVVFVAIGILTALKNPRSWLIVLIWLAIAPLAAALTFQSPHALRAHNMVIPLTLLSSLGIASILEKYKTKLVIGIISLIMLLSFTRYLHQYWAHMSKDYTFSSQYGVKELVNHLSDKLNKYDHIVVTDRYDQPYILFLFYLKYPPKQFQGNHALTEKDNFGFSTVRNFDNFVFKQIEYDGDKIAYPNSLIIGTDEQIPSEANIIKKIYGSNGHLYFEIVEN